MPTISHFPSGVLGVSKADSFDKNVEKYESWFERNRPAYELEVEAIRALLQRSGKSLEIGVGTGRFAAPLGVSFGIGPSKNMGEAAIKRGIEVILGVGENLPCEEGSLDIVLMVTTVRFLDEVPGAFKEAYRVLGKGVLFEQAGNEHFDIMEQTNQFEGDFYVCGV